jgi:hypothetical protein
MVARREEQTGPGEIRPTREYDLSELSIRTFKGLNGLGAQRNVVFFELEYRLRADHDPIAASHHVGQAPAQLSSKPPLPRFNRQTQLHCT